MDKVTDKGIETTSPNVASASADFPPFESLIFFKDSGQFIGSESSLDLSDISLSSSSLFSSNEALDDFSEMLAQLPIKRGLSKFYKGKSRTFISLSDVKCGEDLAKREIPHRKRAQNSSQYSPKAIISKKAGKSPFTSF